MEHSSTIGEKGKSVSVPLHTCQDEVSSAFSIYKGHLAQKALCSTQHTGEDVVSEDVEHRGEVGSKNPSVQVKEVLEAVHVGSLHKVLSVLQLGQQAVLLSQPEKGSKITDVFSF